jgi:hypothetical protein
MIICRSSNFPLLVQIRDAFALTVRQDSATRVKEACYVEDIRDNLKKTEDGVRSLNVQLEDLLTRLGRGKLRNFCATWLRVDNCSFNFLFDDGGLSDFRIN